MTSAGALQWAQITPSYMQGWSPSAGRAIGRDASAAAMRWLDVRPVGRVKAAGHLPVFFLAGGLRRR